MIILECFFCEFWPKYLIGTPLSFEQFFQFSHLLKILGANFFFLIESIRRTNILSNISICYYINAQATTFASSKQSFGQY